MEVKFFLKDGRAIKDTSIFARITYANKPQFKYYLSEKITPQHWNQKEQKARRLLKGYVSFNDLLETHTTQMKDVYRTFFNAYKTEPEPQQLKQLFDTVIRPDLILKPKEEIISVNHLIPHIRRVIELSDNGTRLNSKGQPIAKGTIKNYKTTCKILEELQKNRKRAISFEDIDLDFYTEFTGFLTNVKHHATNTIGKHIQVIKTMLNDATERGINTTMFFARKSFKKPMERSHNIYLNGSELKLIGKLDLSDNPTLDKTRDLFLIGCYTGVRFSDWYKITPNDVDKDFIEITTTKT